MWRSILQLGLGLTLTSVIVSAQHQPTQTSNLDAYRAQALQSALGGTPGSKPVFTLGFKVGSTTDIQSFGSRFSLPSIQTGTGLPAVPGQIATPGQNTCAIPLTTVPVNSAIDPKIRFRLRPNSLAMDPASVRKAMPVCRK